MSSYSQGRRRQSLEKSRSLDHSASAQRRARRNKLSSPPVHGRGWMSLRKAERKEDGYLIKRHPINFAGSRSVSKGINPRVALSVLLTLIVVLIIVLVLVLVLN